MIPIFSTLLLLASIIIITVNGSGDDEIKAKHDELVNLKDRIHKKIVVLQTEIHEKFEKSKMHDEELVKIQMELSNLYKSMINSLGKGYEEMLKIPEITSCTDEVNDLLYMLTISNIKIEPALNFLDSSKKIFKNIFNFSSQKLGWVDFIFNIAMKQLYEKLKLTKLNALPKIRNSFGKWLALIEKGQIHIKKWIDKQEMQKFELYARHLYLLDIVNSSIELCNELAKIKHPKLANTIAARLGDNFSAQLHPKYLKLERDIWFLFGTFQSDANPIDEEMAKELATGDKIILDKLLNAARNEEEELKDEEIYGPKNEDAKLKQKLKKLSLNDDENWNQLREWESKVLVQLGHILMAYFGEEEKYLEKIGNILDADFFKILNALTKLKMISTNWFEDLIDYTNDAPLLKENGGEPVIWSNGIRVQQKSKYPESGFVDLFLNIGHVATESLLTYQAFRFMKFVQIKKDFELVENKKVKTGKDNFFIIMYNKHRQFIEKMIKMSSIVWAALILHIRMQHWYLEKNPENAEKVKKYFNELQKTLKNYGIKKGIDEEMATKLANKYFVWNPLEIHNLYKHLFGVEYDPYRMENAFEWTLIVSIGRLVKFFYEEKGDIEKKLNMAQSGVALSSSSVNTV